VLPALPTNAPTGNATRGGAIALGFGTFFRKEVTDWIRGRRILVVGAVAIVSAVFATLVPFLIGENGTMPGDMSMDPTVNVLFGWSGPQVAIVAVLATMALMSTERDTGTLGWNLTQPLSRTSILAAKWAAGVLIYGGVGVVLPLGVSSAVATAAYGAAPDLATIGVFAALYLMVPALYIGLTIALGAALRGAAAVAGAAFLVAFLLPPLGELIPLINDIAPTSVERFAMAVATGQPVVVLNLIGWLGGMIVLAVAAKLAFDRQEF